MRSVNGKVVLITGGANGIGAEVARRLHGKGAKLVLTDLDEGIQVLRRATALNAHPLNRAAAVRLNAHEAQQLGLVGGSQVRVGDVSLPLLVDPTVPDGVAWIEAAQDLTATLPPYGAAITLSKA